MGGGGDGEGGGGDGWVGLCWFSGGGLCWGCGWWVGVEVGDRVG